MPRRPACARLRRTWSARPGSSSRPARRRGARPGRRPRAPARRPSARLRRRTGRCRGGRPARGRAPRRARWRRPPRCGARPSPGRPPPRERDRSRRGRRAARESGRTARRRSRRAPACAVEGQAHADARLRRRAGMADAPAGRPCDGRRTVERARNAFEEQVVVLRVADGGPDPVGEHADDQPGAQERRAEPLRVFDRDEEEVRAGGEARARVPAVRGRAARAPRPAARRPAGRRALRRPAPRTGWRSAPATGGG